MTDTVMTSTKDLQIVFSYNDLVNGVNYYYYQIMTINIGDKLEKIADLKFETTNPIKSPNIILDTNGDINTFYLQSTEDMEWKYMHGIVTPITHSETTSNSFDLIPINIVFIHLGLITMYISTKLIRRRIDS